MHRAWVVAILVAGCHGGSEGGHDGGDDLSASLDGGSRDAADSLDGGESADGGTVSPEWKSGTRLRAKTYRTSAGAEMFSTWHDTLLDTDCSWITDGSGIVRCAPAFDGILFADAACTMPIYEHASCEAPPAYITTSAAACGTPTLHRIGAAVAAPTMIYSQTGTSCQALGPPDAGYSYYAASMAQVSSLVAGTLSREARGETLAADVFTTADGAIDSRAILDVANDAHCRISSTTLDRCTPVALAFADEFDCFTDAACSTPLAYFPQLAAEPFCSDPPAAEQTMTGYLGVGSLYSGDLYRSTAGTCASFARSSVPAGGTFYTEGPPLSATAFAAFSSTTSGSDRVQLTTLRSSDGVPLRQVGYFDQQRMEACAPYVASDAQLRCLPVHAGSSTETMYADAGCTTPVLVVYSGAVPPEFLSTTEPDLCSETSSVYATGAMLASTAPIYNYGGPGSCTATIQESSYAYYAAGAPLPATDFAPLTLAVE